MLLLLLMGCDDLFGPGFAGETIYYVPSDAPHLLREMDLETGVVRARLSLPGDVLTAARASDRHLYLRLTKEGDRPELVRVDLCRMEIDWRQELDLTDEPPLFDGYRLAAGFHIGVSPTGRMLYLSSARRGRVRGVAAFDVQEHRPTAFAGPFHYATTVLLPASALYPEGVVLLNGSRERRGPGGVYLLHPETLEVLDSIPPTSVGLTSFGAMRGPPDERTIYLMSLQGGALIRYSIETGEVLARHTIEREFGGYSFAPDGMLLVHDLHNMTYLIQGSGLLRLFSPDLEPIGQVDLSTPLGREPESWGATQIRGTIVNRSGSRAYVRSGAQVFQAPHVSVVDLERGQVIRTFETEFSMGFILPPACSE